MVKTFILLHGPASFLGNDPSGQEKPLFSSSALEPPSFHLIFSFMSSVNAGLLGDSDERLRMGQNGTNAGPGA